VLQRRGPRSPVPAELLVLGGVVSVQVGAAVATTLFDRLGAAGTAWLRLLLAAIALLAWARPPVRSLTRATARPVLLFALSLAAMNTLIYFAIERIPLGIAVTVEFVGPLGLAVLASRRRIDLLWVSLAGAGVLLLGGSLGDGLDPVGLACALGAGLCWAAYIVYSARVGAALPGLSGLTAAMLVAAALTTPGGVLSAGHAVLDWRVMLAAAGVALLSSVVPYSLELEALRRLPVRVFGVLMSLEPAVAALAGLVVLGELLAGREVAAIALVVAASAGSALSSRRAAPGPN